MNRHLGTRDERSEVRGVDGPTKLGGPDAGYDEKKWMLTFSGVPMRSSGTVGAELVGLGDRRGGAFKVGCGHVGHVGVERHVGVEHLVGGAGSHAAGRRAHR